MGSVGGGRGWGKSALRGVGEAGIGSHRPLDGSSNSAPTTPASVLTGQSTTTTTATIALGVGITTTTTTTTTTA